MADRSNHPRAIFVQDQQQMVVWDHFDLELVDFNDPRMQCSREERGGKALLIFGLDAPLSTSVLDHITSSKHILSVKVADLSKGL